MLLRISFFQQHQRKWRYIFAAPSNAITVVHRALQESPKARDDLLVKGDARTPNPPRLARARRYHADHADIGAGLVGAAIGQR